MGGKPAPGCCLLGARRLHQQPELRRVTRFAQVGEFMHDGGPFLPHNLSRSAYFSSSFRNWARVRVLATSRASRPARRAW